MYGIYLHLKIYVRMYSAENLFAFSPNPIPTPTPLFKPLIRIPLRKKPNFFLSKLMNDTTKVPTGFVYAPVLSDY